MRHCLLLTSLLPALTTSALSIAPEDLGNLSLVSPFPTGGDIRSLTANGNTLVAGGLSGTVIASTNGGASWQAQSPITELGVSALDGLANDGTNYVGFGSNKIFVSTDYNSWTSGSFFASPNDIEYGNGLFVIASTSSSKIFVSANGTGFTAASSLPAGLPGMNSVAYGGGVFVAGGEDGTLIRSTDGQTWTTEFSGIPGRSGINNRFDYLSYANSMFFATGDDSLIYTSPDGLTWTARTTDEPGNYRSVAYVGGRYVFGNTLSGTYTTTDLLDYENNGWGNTTGSQEAFAYVGSTLVNVGRSGYIGTTTDGLNWTERRERLGDEFNSVAFGAGIFSILDPFTKRVFTSTNGSSWTFRYMASGNLRTKLVFGNGRFVTIGNDDALTSTDGLTWTESSHNLGPGPDSLHFLNGRFIALGRNGEVSESADGVSWTDRSTTTGLWLYDIAYGNGVYAIANAGNEILTSTDLTSWTARSTGAAVSANFTQIAFGGGEFLASKSLQPLVKSSDGLTWVPVANSATTNIVELEYDSELGFYSLGTQGIVRYFATPGDFTAWTNISLPVSLSVSGIREENGTIVLVGSTGLIMTADISDFGYSNWVGVNFPGQTDPQTIGQDADPDKDGATNFEEYARSTNPNSSTPPLVVAYDRSLTGPRIQWTHTNPPEDVEVSAEYSTDLVTWLTSGLILNATPGATDTSYSAEVTGVSSNGGSLFLRVRWSPQN